MEDQYKDPFTGCVMTRKEYLEYLHVEACRTFGKKEVHMYTYDTQIFSDFYKEVFGYRPRNHEFYYALPARKQVLWDELEDSLELAKQADAIEVAAAVDSFEADIVRIRSSGAPTRQDAIRWLADSIDEEDPYGLMWQLNLPWDNDEYRKEITRALEKFA